MSGCKIYIIVYIDIESAQKLLLKYLLYALKQKKNDFSLPIDRGIKLMLVFILCEIIARINANVKL